MVRARAHYRPNPGGLGRARDTPKSQTVEEMLPKGYDRITLEFFYSGVPLGELKVAARRIVSDDLDYDTEMARLRADLRGIATTMGWYVSTTALEDLN